MTYRTATDAVTRRRGLDGGPSPFRAPQASTVEEPPYDDPYSTDEEFPPTRSDDVHYGRHTPDRFDVPLDPSRYRPITRTLSPQRRVAQARANSRSWLRILATIAGIALLATCSAGTFFLLRDGTVTPNEAEAPAAPAVAPPGPDPLDNRATDPEPVTLAEVFPDEGVVAASGTYTVVRSESLTKCAPAATDELAKLIDLHECTQVVRATMLSPDGAYAMTAGVVNLIDADSAQKVRVGIESDVGDFTTLPGGGRTSGLGRTSSVLGYNTYGHYLLYVVMAPTSGPTDQADPAYTSIVGDIVETHLAEALRPRHGA